MDRPASPAWLRKLQSMWSTNPSKYNRVCQSRLHCEQLETRENPASITDGVFNTMPMLLDQFGNSLGVAENLSLSKDQLDSPDALTAVAFGNAVRVMAPNLPENQQVSVQRFGLIPFGNDFNGQLSVALGDFNADGVADVAVGMGAPASQADADLLPPLVRIFDGKTGNVLSQFFAYSQQFTGGVRIAAGDITGDGRDDLITAAGPGGGPHVQVFDGKSLTLENTEPKAVRSFFAYAPDFATGLNVIAGQFSVQELADGRLISDGVDDIAVMGESDVAPARIFDGTLLSSNQSNGVIREIEMPTWAGFTNYRFSSGDLNGDSIEELIFTADSLETGSLTAIVAYQLTLVEQDNGVVKVELKQTFGSTSAFITPDSAVQPNVSSVDSVAKDLNGDGFDEVILLGVMDNLSITGRILDKNGMPTSQFIAYQSPSPNFLDVA